jgi:hypothetical protein
MKKLTLLAALATVISAPLPVLAAPTPATMYKNPSCSCCESYAAYLEQNGFEVDIRPTNDLAQVSTTLGVPATLQGCHTVEIDGYLVSGFVPVSAVNKMLAERPAIAGIAMAGMPMGSPGMGGDKTEPFTIESFNNVNSTTAVYAVE